MADTVYVRKGAVTPDRRPLTSPESSRRIGSEPGRSESDPAISADEAVARLWQALDEVADPEFPMSIVDMGLVVAVQKVERVARLKLTFTAMGCPCMDMIIEDVRARLLREPEVDQVEIEVVWSPVWSKARLSERGREIMLLNGVTV